MRVMVSSSFISEYHRRCLSYSVSGCYGGSFRAQSTKSLLACSISIVLHISIIVKSNFINPNPYNPYSAGLITIGLEIRTPTEQHKILIGRYASFMHSFGGRGVCEFSFLTAFADRRMWLARKVQVVCGMEIQ